MNSSVTLRILPIPLSQVRFCLFSDASFATSEKDRPIAGTLIFTTTPELQANQVAPMCPMVWGSKGISRVVKSTFSAESITLSQSLDRLSWIRLFWALILNPKLNWRKPQGILNVAAQAVAVTDCKSVYDISTKTVIPTCAEYRTTLECLMIKERLAENVELRWIHTQALLADSLTKSMDANLLRHCLATGRYALYDESANLKSRSDKKVQHAWYQKENQSVTQVPEEEPVP